MGDPNASIPTPQPVHYRPQFGAVVKRAAVTFVSKAAMKGKALDGLQRPLVPVKNVRKVGKKHMIHNAYLPKMQVDPETYEVRADGELLVCEPAKVLPLAQRYFLF
jgi:urease subunit alpha